MARKLVSLVLCCLMLAGCMPISALALNNLYIGQEIVFGAYEQDGVAGNGKEGIVWIVADIDQEENAVLLVSKYGLYAMPYHSSTRKTPWKNCDVRNWLNNSFYYDAFSPSERAQILETTVSGSRDMVFLLNQREIQNYFRSEMLSATAYALKKGAYYAADTGCVSWWVRQDRTEKYGTFVGAHGGFYTRNNPVTAKDNAIRPAINLPLSAVLGADEAGDTGIWAINNQRIQTRSGPSTQYDGIGAYFNEGGHPVRVISRAADNNGVWWLQVEFEYGGKWVRVYTGLKRVDVNIHAVPDDPQPIGWGSVSYGCTAYYGPGYNYKTHQKGIPAGTAGEILASENGFVCMEFRDAAGKNPRRVWLEYSCVNWRRY